MGFLGLDVFDEVKRMNKRQIYYQVLTIAMVVASALMIWKLLVVLSYSESPLVVVLSGSMEPAFYRGDVLYLTNYPDEPIRVGDIVVFKIEGREIPIVHRVLKLHERLVYTLMLNCGFLVKCLSNSGIESRDLPFGMRSEIYFYFNMFPTLKPARVSIDNDAMQRVLPTLILYFL
ncbi:unnamed protein product [Trichobilharzia regenti]|nr:unnamed protein product [Trichobilharzia regenti]